jgi:fructuronate reductase
LAALSPSAQRFHYDRSSIRPGIVHLGVGAFHRAHQAVVMDDCLNRGERDWGIVGASLRSADTAEALRPQDGLYALAVRDNERESLRIIGALTGLIAPGDGHAALLARMVDPRVRIVSLTITEKGYCYTPASGALNEDHPDIKQDLANPDHPTSAIGILTAALFLRRKNGVAPFTVLSCDNLPANGKTVKRVLDRYAAMADPELGKWVRDHVVCPGSMVDRIVPSTTDEDRVRISATLGFEDRWPVVTEPFLQWVIEDNFPTGRPDFAASGVQLVADVAPFERMKLRLLNGAHSTIAYLGCLAGHETVADAMAVPAFSQMIRTMMDVEISPTLTLPAGADLESYKTALITRFKNAALRHKTAQIAMDGSQKIPQRLLGTIRDRLVAGAPINALSLSVASWMRYVTGFDEQGKALEIKDPMAARLKLAATTAGPNAQRLATELFQIADIFGADLPQDTRFTQPVSAALERLFERGAAQTVRDQKGFDA